MLATQLSREGLLAQRCANFMMPIGCHTHPLPCPADEDPALKVPIYDVLAKIISKNRVINRFLTTVTHVNYLIPFFILLRFYLKFKQITAMIRANSYLHVPTWCLNSLVEAAKNQNAIGAAKTKRIG